MRYISIGILIFGLIVNCINNHHGVHAIVWDTTSQVLKRDGQPTVIQGFAVTCMEYLLRGIGVKCTCAYDFNNRSQIITKPDPELISTMVKLMLPAPAGITPAVRFSLNAGYYLDIETPNWKNNRAQNPKLSDQYKLLLENLVREFTSRGILTILDLHWNDDVTEQENMALRSATNLNTGDSIEFWTKLAQKFGNNDLVMYELYNEPFDNTYQVWSQGGGRFEGMKQMYDAVRLHTDNPIIIAGRTDFAYDSQSLVDFDKDFKPVGVIYNLHPYMGPLQQGDPTKNVPGYEVHAARLLSIQRPLIITEFGQFCCDANGQCFQYKGTHEGVSMGYVEALLTVNKNRGISWTTWGHRPTNPGTADCNQPDATDGVNLYNPANYANKGAPWVVLYPKFYGNVNTSPPPAGGNPTTQAPSTKAPTTKAPATQAPTTKAPATQAPTTKAPATQAPTTKAPSTKAPTTKTPTNEGATFTPSTTNPTISSSSAEATSNNTFSPNSASSNEMKTEKLTICILLTISYLLHL